MAAADVFTIQDSDLMVLAAGGALTQIQESAKVQASADSDAVKAILQIKGNYMHTLPDRKRVMYYFTIKSRSATDRLRRWRVP